MSIKISGILPGPTGEPAAHIGITLRAIKTSLTVITTLESNSITGIDGAYSLNVEPGQYDVLLWVDGINARNVGTITVYSDSLPGTLNNFLTALREEDGTPEIIRQLEQLRAEALQAALEAKASKDESTHQANIATNAAENAAQETADLIKAAVKADADRAESARDGAETAQSTVNTQAAEVALHHTEVGKLASAASNSAALAVASANSAAQSASESESSKNASAKSELSALAGAEAAGNSATAAEGDKTAAKGFRDEAEEFAARAKASAESIDVSALEEQINQKVSQTEFDDAIADKASNQALTDGLAEKLDTKGGTLTGPLILASDATEPKGAVTKQQLDEKPVGGLPLLHSYPADTRDHIEEGTAPQDGQLLSRALFPDAWAAIQATRTVITDAAWLADPLKRGCFSSGDGSTTFRLPDKNGKSSGTIGAGVPRGDGTNSSGSIGTIQRDASQNFTGAFSSDLGGMVWLGASSTSGVFSSGSRQEGNIFQPKGDTFNRVSANGSFDIDISRQIRTAAETRMLNFTVCWVIKLAGSAFNEGQINALELATQVTLLTTRVTTLESDVFTASQVANTPWVNLTLQNGWTATNGRAAYRKVNGMLQIDIININGGTTSGAVTVFTLPTGYRPVTNRIYIITAASPWTSGGFPPRLSIATDGSGTIEAVISGSPLYLSVNIPLQ
ncbi:prophage tail fiber N-terminal domain-containing protein [Yersinia enterocolitica]|uniref:prophage tail fiber N-terminal domain-containing protein n=1 Tax=Yersinia enterocolitica TaxID=630 RepID=UPI00398D5C28